MPAYYGTEEEFTSYHTERGRNVPNDWNIPQLLLVASEWLDSAFDEIWFGYATGGYNQERSWPRIGAMTNTDPTYVFSETETPSAVLKATYEAAFREGTTTGSLTKDYEPLKYKKASVDGAVDVEFIIPNDASETQLQMPIIHSLMYPLIDPRRSVKSSFSGALTRV